MGEVYRADDLKLGQTVALKFLPRALERDPHRLALLLDEVKLARQVSHPNVCGVWDAGESEGLHFLAIEYVEGEDLNAVLRRIGRLPEERAVQVAAEICAGLAAIHEESVLHRDLKPANLMLDGRGRVRITDPRHARRSRRRCRCALRHACLHSARAVGTLLVRFPVSQSVPVALSAAAIMVSLWAIALKRSGLLGAVTAMMTFSIFNEECMTLHPGAWYAGVSRA
jgi:serine/threonine protein kinase